MEGPSGYQTAINPSGVDCCELSCVFELCYLTMLLSCVKVYFSCNRILVRAYYQLCFFAFKLIKAKFSAIKLLLGSQQFY